MDVNVEKNVEEKRQAEEKKEALKSITWTLIGVLAFTILMALACRYLEFRIRMMI